MDQNAIHATLEQRVTELETRLAFQEETIAQLNDALSQARLELGAQTGLLRRMMDDLRQARTVQSRSVG